MAIFRKSDHAGRDSAARRTRTRGTPSGRTSEGAISIIGAGTEIVGDVTSDGIVRIEGSVNGTVRAAQAVVLGRGGEVVGDVITPEAVIGGTVTGSVTAEQRLEVQGTGIVEGEICTRAQHLQIHEGARVSGRIRMVDASAEPLRALPAGTPPTPVSTELSTSERKAVRQ
jgi:cytoskeletal protein CcmA (bactofilin family)